MQTPAPLSESHYDLNLRAGRNGGFFSRTSDRGVTLTAARIDWTFKGKSDGAPLHNICAVHLQTGGDWREPTSLCTVTFADGYKLVVVNSDHARRPLYRQFVLDLHKRLTALRTTAVFTSGYQGFLYPLTIACAVLLGIVCIVGPIAAMILQRGIGTITVMFAGVALFWPLAKILGKNVPRSYDPNNLPEELLG